MEPDTVTAAEQEVRCARPDCSHLYGYHGPDWAGPCRGMVMTFGGPDDCWCHGFLWVPPETPVVAAPVEP